MKLEHKSILLLRDQSSLDYLQAGEENSQFVKLATGNLLTLQPSLYFQALSTAHADYWIIKTSNNQFLKVNTTPGPNLDQIRWVATDPQSPAVIDKSPYYFTFHRIVNEEKALYVIGTYYNGGMTLQQPSGPGTALQMGKAEPIRGSAPEIVFEMAVTVESQIPLANMNGLPAGLNSSPSTSSVNALDTGSSAPLSSAAIVLLTLFSTIAFLTVLFLAAFVWSKWKITKKPAAKVGGGFMDETFSYEIVE